jgi:hypothetical protein
VNVTEPSRRPIGPESLAPWRSAIESPNIYVFCANAPYEHLTLLGSREQHIDRSDKWPRCMSWLDYVLIALVVMATIAALNAALSAFITG